MEEKSNDPLHGKTLEMILTDLVNFTFPLNEIGYLNESSFKFEGLNSGNLA